MDTETTVASHHATAKLELGEILNQLAAQCRYSVAMQRAREIGPSGDPQQVRYLLDVTAEAVQLGVQFPDLSIGGARDIRDFVNRAEKGVRLQSAELLLIMDTLRAGRELRRFFQRLADASTRYPNMLEFAEAIDNFSPLETDLTRSIGPRGDVLDSASEALSRIRKAVRVAHSRLQDRLHSFISGGRFGSALQENIITMREGRYVVPVRSDARGVVKGIVHDTSASGQTLFVEPFDVVELNNRWREQQMEEQREVDRILDMLSSKIGDEADGIGRMVEAIAAIDLAMAKARLAGRMEATRPRIHTPVAGRRVRSEDASHPSHYLRLVQARHPLIDPNEVVPTDIEIGERYRVLLITGPNTGGKTVALKTVGLLTLMAQTGLFIPADDTSVVSVFPSIYVDIGDEQSIEQSLSTFSSHIRNIIAMLEHVGSDSLVLLDEVGAGTDPQEGSALARAIISELLRKRAMVIATTHYSEVKAYAYATRGVENASVEFDVKSLRPTYRLMIGIPGKSNALAIATRLGMPKQIIDEAGTMLEPGDTDAAQLIDDIRTRRDEISRELDSIKRAEDEVRELRRRAARNLREAEELKRIAREEAIAEVQGELASAREAAREIGRQHLARSTAPTVDRQQMSRSLKEAEETVKSVQRRKQPRGRQIQVETTPIRLGDRVKVLAFDEEGEVVRIDERDAEIQMGSLKVRQPIASLERIGRARQPQLRPSASLARDLQSSMEAVPIELDLRGKRAEEIGPIVDSYVNDAYLMGMPFVRIIHGKGTGALRQVVRDLLREIPVVSKSEPAGAKEGGEGATVAHLRQT
jgi:DNA mismatch repair protein MutS2